MSYKNPLPGLIALALVAGATAASAQTATTGSIQGQVVDAKGAPVAGAMVRLSSAQVTRTLTTGSDGRYQMGLLNAGSWQITVSKQGFSTQTMNIALNINETQSQNIKLLTEATVTVEVLGSAQAVDTTSTTAGMKISLDSLAALPVSRSVNDLAFLSPGVAGGGSTFGGQAPGLGVSINGASGAENTWIVDGLNTNDFRYGGTATNLPTDFIESVDVQTGGFKPEFGALGGVFTVVTKSGTNDFSGSAWVNYDPYDSQAVNKRTAYFDQSGFFAAPPIRAAGGNFLGDSASRKRTEVGATAGGAFVKDKLFYWVGVDSITSSSPSYQNFSDITVGKKDEDALNAAVKVNWYLTESQQLTGSYFTSKLTDDDPNDRPGLYGDANAGFKHVVKSDNFALNYDWTIKSDLLLSVKVGVAKVDDKMDPVDTNLAQITDRHWYNGGGGGTGTPFQQQSAFIRGGFGRYNPHDTGETDQIKADLSWFLDRHNLKFGVSSIESTYHRTAATTGGFWWTIRANGTRIDGRQQTDDSKVKATFNAFYAQDTWEIINGLKIFYGFRYETQDQKDNHNKSFMKFTSFKDYAQPRLGFTWDPNNDGRSKVSGSFARYFEQIPQRLAARVYGSEVYFRYRWTQGGTGTDGTPQTYTYSSTGTGTYTGGPRITDFAGPYSHDAIAEGTKLPRRTEYTLGLEHTYDNGLTVGLHGKYRTFDNIIEDSTIRNLNGDPSLAVDPTGQERAILWNPGRSVTYYTNNNAGQTVLIHSDNTLFDPAKNIYKAVDLTLEKKTQRSLFNFSYTWSRLEGNYEGLISSSNGQADASITASWDEWPYVGYGILPLDRTHVAKLLMSRNWDLGPGVISLGANITYQSGTPISLFDDGSTTLGSAPGTNPALDYGGYGNAVPANFQLGQYGRTPSVNNTDIHIDYAWKLNAKLRLSPSVDVYNVFNSRPGTRVLEQATDSAGAVDPRYGQETDWARGRRLRVGLKLTF